MFDFKEGTTWEWTNYDKKGKLTGKTLQTVDKYSISGGDIAATLTLVSEDDKGEKTEPISMDFTCKDGVVYYDMKKFVPEQYLSDENGELNVEVTGNNLEMPTNMKEGDVLKDASVTMDIGGSDSPMPIKFTVNINNRKVLSDEKLTTPAGDFDCLVITQTISTKMMVTMEMDSKDWYAEGIGMVKSETSRKGKLISSSVLTKFNK
jgi:hypothetical protein